MNSKWVALVLLVVVFGGCMAAKAANNDFIVTVQEASTSGWVGDDETHTWTLVSVETTSDADVYVVNVDADVTGYIGANMKVRLEDGGVVKYFGILSVGAYAAGVTPVYLFGGTDYVLSGTITEFSYSSARSPFGWPMNPDKWTITKSTSSDVIQTPVTMDTWYEFDVVVLPPGAYRTGYRVLGALDRATGYASFSLVCTLATTSAAETDTSMTNVTAMLAASAVFQDFGHEFRAEKYVDISSETSFYLNMKSVYPVDAIVASGASLPTVIYAVWGGL